MCCRGKQEEQQKQVERGWQLLLWMTTTVVRVNHMCTTYSKTWRVTMVSTERTWSLRPDDFASVWVRWIIHLFTSSEEKNRYSSKTTAAKSEIFQCIKVIRVLQCEQVAAINLNHVTHVLIINIVLHSFKNTFEHHPSRDYVSYDTYLRLQFSSIGA